MPARKPRYFMLTYADREARTFNVEGPITNDTDVNARTAELQAKGRRVYVTTTAPQVDRSKVPSRESLIHAGFHGFTYDPDLRW